MAVPAWYKAYTAARKFASVTHAVTDTTNLGTEVHDITGYDRLSMFWVHVTAISGTSASVVVTIQYSWDNGITWVDGDSSAAIVVAGGAIDVRIVPTMAYGPKIRVKDVVAATTTPSITYEVHYGFDRLSKGLPRAA